MGIKLFAKLLKNECYNQTKKIHLSALYGKKICIDTSIYLYRFKANDALIENFFTMCSLFKKYNIIPMFVFDGKPPEEKREELDNRRRDREKSKETYNKLVSELGENISIDDQKELNKLKRNMISITKEDVNNVKVLFDSYGIKYINALGEADILCASLVLKKKVYAVLTEDMDLFAYGSPIVLRYFSLLQHTRILYDLKIILSTLGINSKKEFQLLCVLSGNDYYNSKNNIYYYLKIYKKYKKTKENIDLLDWLLKYNYVLDKNEILNILNLYLNINKELSKYKYVPIKFGSVCEESLKEILKKERFIF